MYLTMTLHNAVQSNPERPATIFRDRVTTYADTRVQVARLAGGLRGLGVEMGDRVAILALNSDYYAQYFLAVPWAGGVLLPLNIRWSVAENSYAINDAGSTILLVDDMFAPMVPALQSACPELTTIVFCGEGETPEGMTSIRELIADSAPIEDEHRSGEDLAGIFYTGGTTGAPKGVMLSHRNLFTSAVGSCAAGFLKAGGPLLHAAPMFHLADLASWAAQSLLGGTHVIIPMFDPTAVLSAISDHKVSGVLLVPTMVQMVVDHPDKDSYDLSSLVQLIYGAAPISEAVVKRAKDLFVNASFLQAYGMTEVSPVATLLQDEDHSDPIRNRSGGRAAPHCQVRIFGPDDLEVPLGTVGQVVVRGDNVMSGYWNKPQESEDALRGGWMHTGDGGYMDEAGFVYIVDRIKDMIISGGENVYSVEVENVIAKHPAVASCAVIGVPDDQWGERVHAVVVLQAGVQLDEADLREFCKEHIAGYKAPRSVEVRDALPISGAGKILKRELRAPYWAHADRSIN